MNIYSARTSFFSLLTLLALLFGSLPAAYAEEPTNPAAAVIKSHVMTTPSEIKWGPCSPALPPGAQCAFLEGDPKAANVLFSYRLKMPNHYRISPHSHPADEHLFIVKGSFNMGMGDTLDEKATKAMVAGSFVVMPKGTHHFAWTKGETIIQVYAIGPWSVAYVNPADDPRNKK